MVSAEDANRCLKLDKTKLCGRAIRVEKEKVLTEFEII